MQCRQDMTCTTPGDVMLLEVFAVSVRAISEIETTKRVAKVTFLFGVHFEFVQVSVRRTLRM
eukprot:2962871-Karenia_brevis.AAC.1